MIESSIGVSGGPSSCQSNGRRKNRLRRGEPFRPGRKCVPFLPQTLPSAIYTFTQVPGGETGALRLTLVSIVISMAALVVSEVMARRVGHGFSFE